MTLPVTLPLPTKPCPGSMNGSRDRKHKVWFGEKISRFILIGCPGGRAA
jgi:hypothetical protein